MTESKYIGNWRPHCSKCGRFVGKDGYIDIAYDEYNGGWEEGYHLCAKCQEERNNMRTDKSIRETLKNLAKMEKETANHSVGCSCHTCIYKRDIQSRPEIRSAK